MYASLDSMDLVAEEPTGRVAIQTDHRDAGEIEAMWDLSVVFLLARALNPQRSGGLPVRFALLGQPSDRFIDLIAKAGAEAELVGASTRRPPALDADAVDAAAHDALRRLGARVLAENEANADESGIEAVLREYDARLASFGGKDESAISYWTAVVEAGAAVGETLIRRHGSRWVRDPKFFGVVPYMVGTAEGSLSNVFDKVERYFEHGESESPTALLRLAEDAGLPAGPVMFNLRPATWGARAESMWRPLLGGGEHLDDADLPVVALVRDLPSSVANLPATTPEDQRATLEAEALANLRAVRVVVEDLDAGTPVVLVHGDYYAAEKLLDPEFVGGLHARLDSPLLAAAIPVKGRLFFTSALAEPARVVALGMLAAQQHDEAPPNQRLSTEVFLVSEGKVVGIARANGDATRAQGGQEPKRKGFWARLFGW
jgi:hypothetical protein